MRARAYSLTEECIILSPSDPLKMTQAVVLAAGKGTRMQSDLPKVLHRISDKTLLDHVLDTVFDAGISRCVVVVGHEAELVEKTCGRPGLKFVLQEPQLGTGHAVQMAIPELDPRGLCLVLAGDVPLLRVETIGRILAAAAQSSAAAIVLTCVVPDAAAYGRILKDESGAVVGIVEARDATAEELLIQEYNTGVFCFRTRELISALENLTPDNSQGEFYLTDTVADLVARGLRVEAVVTEDPHEVVGINTTAELEIAGRLLAEREG